MEERKYLKWYHKVGYGSGDVAGNGVYTLAVFLLISLLRVEKANEKILAERKDKTVPDVYGNV